MNFQTWWKHAKLQINHTFSVINIRWLKAVRLYHELLSDHKSLGSRNFIFVHPNFIADPFPITEKRPGGDALIDKLRGIFHQVLQLYLTSHTLIFEVLFRFQPLCRGMWAFSMCLSQKKTWTGSWRLVPTLLIWLSWSPRSLPGTVIYCYFWQFFKC